MIGARWRPPLRIARRTARRSLGRTVLVASLVAAPVLGATFLDTAFRTADLTGEAKAEREMGAADATLSVTPYTRITVVGGNGVSTEQDVVQRDPATVRPAALLPPGSRLVRTVPRQTVTFAVGDRVTLAGAEQLDTRDPVTAGRLALRSGRLAAAPDEVALSPSLADRLGAGVGEEVRLARGAALRVVGLAADPSCRSCQLAAGLPGWTGVPGDRSDDYLVDLPDGAVVDRALRNALAGSGVLLVPRDALLHPEQWAEPGDSTYQDTTLLAIVVLVVGIGMLEIVLLAGAAFAVAARRQVRDAALVLSNGGRRADVRRMLLAQGAVLGVVGAVGGLALGVGTVLAAWSPLQRLTDQDFAGLVVSPRDLAVIGGIGVLSGIAAAVVPAWSASRVPVVAALAGRYGRPTRARSRITAAATAATVLGLVLAAVVSWLWAAARRAAEGDPGGDPGLLYPLGMLAGFGIAMIGLTVLAPTLVALAGRLAGRLPLTGRLAVRDAARQRHRTGPAVGAVMVAVAGSVAVAFAVASYDEHDRDMYVPKLPAGWASVYLSYGGTPAGVQDELALVRAAATELPATSAVPVETAVPIDPAARNYGGASWDYDQATPCTGSGQVGVGTATAGLIAGVRAAEAGAALAAGKAVVTDPCLIRDGTATLLITEPERSADGTPDPGRTAERRVRVPAVLLPSVARGLPSGAIGTRAATAAGLTGQASQVVLPTNRMPTDAEEDRARAALGLLGSNLQVERGYGAPYLGGFLALIGGAGLVTLAGVAISVSLSAAEGRADLATLAAVGAPPRRRRGLAMVQAALVAGLGAGLGVLLGAAIGLTVMSGLDSYPLVVPWPTVLLVGFGVPALGVLAVGLVTRSRLPMIRRIG